MNYIKLLNLQIEPFSNSPDPSFFYLSKTYQICLQNLEISIRLKRGLNVVLGDIGTGKTTLSRALIQRFQDNTDGFNFHLILDPSFISENEFLYALLMGFGLPRPNTDSLFESREAIRQFLLREGLEKGKTIILIIDEGQKLNEICIELLRDLLNFETNNYKLLQLVILAQKEFHKKIIKIPNFTDRINTFHLLGPLDREETQEMINFRLYKAGWSLKNILFSQEAIDLIYKHSMGYPRRIITLCHHSLIGLLIKRKDVVTPEIIKFSLSRIYDKKKVLFRTRKWDILRSFNSKNLAGKMAQYLISFILLTLIILLFLTIFLYPRDLSTIRLSYNYLDSSLDNGVIKKNISIKDKLDSNVNNSFYIQKSDMPKQSFSKDVHEQFFSPEAMKELRKENENQIDKWPVSIVVKEGDTVYELAKKTYNVKEVTQPVYKLIITANPHIQDINYIREGEKLFFPELDLLNITK